MQINVNVLTGIPCAKCLFWEPFREKPIDCDPPRCHKLTEWLLKEAEKFKPTEDVRVSVL